MVLPGPFILRSSSLANVNMCLVIARKKFVGFTRKLLLFTDIPSYAKLKDLPNLCLSILPILCSCLFGGDEPAKLRNVTIMTRRFQKVEKMLVCIPRKLTDDGLYKRIFIVIFFTMQAESSRYEGRDDFVLEYQPSFLDNVFPSVRLNNGRLTTDYSYMSVDCFHFSQKLHAVGE